MATIHDLCISPDCLVPSPGARQARRDRARERLLEALEARPELRLDRIGPILAILRLYRLGLDGAARPMSAYVATVEAEVCGLETRAAGRAQTTRERSAAVRMALQLLRDFGRISALDFGDVPIEERSALVRLLGLEYRWCIAAAGTTPARFKAGIGRTGAR